MVNRKKNKKKQEIYFWIFSKFFKHTRRKRENKFNMDNKMKKCGHQQMKCVNMNVMSMEIRTPPSLGFWPNLVISQ